ncbi:MAG: preprotein translocase subunit SecY [Actinobacteria bacterium]|nr:preprotein translocase subunit SecY [Actinomycetota bacterium]MBU1943028.1 preprotein translocase subunit SecY [Actinomycetota bacterium]MBU2686910.1 preprotein translocase subunit SecY [Actinomycetota bacterium]
MFSGFRDAFKIPDLRKKILFTFFILALYRVGCFIPAPGVSLKALADSMADNSLMQFLNIFTGGGLSRMAIFGLGIMPYITAEIIMELLSAVIPKIKEWHEEGELGRKKITKVVRYMTLVLATLQSASLVVSFSRNTKYAILPDLTFAKGALIVFTLVAGMALLMWLGELITDRGVGNGMSILIFAGIIAAMPTETSNLVRAAYNRQPALLGVLAVFAVLIVMGVVYIERGERRIPVQYAKQVRGRKMYSGASTYIPVKVNTSGVIPIIFAAAVMTFPVILSQFIPSMKGFADRFVQGSLLYFVMYTGMIIFFAYFYTAIIFDPFELADNLKKYGGFIPGIRPGMPTTNYISKVVNRINLPGSLYLAAIALIPAVMFVYFGTSEVPIGGAAVLIIVGVALETMSQIEAQMQMRHYEGFLSK